MTMMAWGLWVFQPGDSFVRYVVWRDWCYFGEDRRDERKAAVRAGVKTEGVELGDLERFLE